MDKSANPEKMCKRLFSEEEDSSHVKSRCRIISRLISIKVLWEFFYPNTSIKGKLTLDCVYHHLPRSSLLLSCSPSSSRIIPNTHLTEYFFNL